MNCGSARDIVGEVPGAVVAEHRLLPAALAGDEHVEVEVVVDVDELEVPREADLTSGIRSSVASVKRPVPSLIHAACGRRRWSSVAGAPVGEHEVEIAVAVDVAGLEVADAERHLGRCVAVTSRKAPPPVPRNRRDCVW